MTAEILKTLVVLDPTTDPEQGDAAMAVLPSSLDDKVLGLLDNGKPNADKLLEMVASMLSQKFRLAGVVRARKPSAGRGATNEVLDDLASRADLVITGVGD